VTRSTLFAIYGVSKSDLSSFDLTHLFSDEGYIDAEEIARVYREQDGREMDPLTAAGRAGPFSSLEVLQRYAYALCDHLNATQVILIDREEYNQGIERATSMDEMREIMQSMGNIMENADHNKGSIWSRIFS
jgi:hypothetical protein